MVESEILREGQTFDETFDDGIAVKVRSFMPYANLPQLAHNLTLTVGFGREKSEDELHYFKVLPETWRSKDRSTSCGFTFGIAATSLYPPLN